MAMTTAMEEWLPPVLRIARPCLPISNDIPKPFGRNSKLVKNLETLLPVKEDLEKSGRVHLYDGRQVRLISNLASGGEGTVYETDQIGVVCKIYHPNRLTDGARRKIELMVTRRVSYPEICWPTEAVRDGHGIFRGFLMPRAFGEPLGHGPFIPPVWLAKHPNWTRRESVNLTIRILEGIEYLHRIGVLLGDINPMNILVNGANTFYLVDCDSFQVEGFPCPVGSINFVAPEIQGKDFAGFLRTPEHELFAVATLAFMIMMPGKQPYSHQGGADGVANIKKMHFPYPLSGKGSKSIPEGPWRFCWSHLTWGLQKAFHASFDSDFKGQLRVDVSEWLQLFRKYERLLLNNNNVFKGPLPAVGFDLSLLPQNRRYWKNGAGKILPNAIPQHGETELQRSIKMIANALQHAQAKKNQGSSASTGLSSPSAFGTPWKPQLANPLAYASSPSVYPGAGKWYTTTLVWPIIAPVKALLESIVGGIGGGVSLALDRLETRKLEYQKAGVDYFQPWLVLMTDGQPTTSEHNQAGLRACKLEAEGKLVVFPIGIGYGADITTLAMFSKKRSPLRLSGLNFRKFFEWLSKSVVRVSQSRPGEKVRLDLDGIKGWADL